MLKIHTMYNVYISTYILKVKYNCDKTGCRLAWMCPMTSKICHIGWLQAHFGQILRTYKESKLEICTKQNQLTVYPNVVPTYLPNLTYITTYLCTYKHTLDSFTTCIMLVKNDLYFAVHALALSSQIDWFVTKRFQNINNRLMPQSLCFNRWFAKV